MQKTINITTVSLIFIFGVYLLFSSTSKVDSAGWFPVHLQSATTTAVGPDTVKTLFTDETSATCKSRVITTSASPIMISFDDTTGFGSTTISGAAGHLQAASTTVAYDSALYGCGLMSAFAFSSTTITVSSF